MRKFVVALCLALTDPAFAQEIYFVNGHCERLIINGEDVSGDCGSHAAVSAFLGDRIEVILSVGKRQSVDFTGIDIDNPSPDRDAFMLDHVIRTEGGKTLTATPVKGGCTYGNPFKGTMTISCAATDADGKAYEAIFVTDGATPDKVPL